MIALWICLNVFTLCLINKKFKSTREFCKEYLKLENPGIPEPAKDEIDKNEVKFCTIYVIVYINYTQKNRFIMDFLTGSVIKNLLTKAGNAGDVGKVPGLGRSPEGGNGNLLQ